MNFSKIAYQESILLQTCYSYFNFTEPFRSEKIISFKAWSKLWLLDNHTCINLDLFDTSIVEYCTGYLVEKIAMNQSCEKCFNFLLRQNKSDSRYELIHFTDKYNLIHPINIVWQYTSFVSLKWKASATETFLIKIF